jgi:hypothetical protein
MKHPGIVILLELLLCLAVVPCFAGTVNYVEFGLAQGGTANYDASAGTIAWSGGASGRIGLTDGTFLNFDSGGASVKIAGNASGAPGSGSGISMTNLAFTLTYGPYGQRTDSAIVVSGALSGGATYDEKLGGIGGMGATLTGLSTVDVMAYAVNDPYGETYRWIEPTGSTLTTQIIGVRNFTNYSQDYTTNNLTIRVEGEIPEPATMALLGIGAVGILIKRKKN